MVVIDAFITYNAVSRRFIVYYDVHFIHNLLPLFCDWKSPKFVFILFLLSKCERIEKDKVFICYTYFLLFFVITTSAEDKKMFITTFFRSWLFITILNMMREEEEEETVFDQEGLLGGEKKSSCGSAWLRRFLKTIALSLAFFALVSLCYWT